MEQFGSGEREWWRQGVPAEIRKSCVQMPEEDPDPVEDVFATVTSKESRVANSKRPVNSTRVKLIVPPVRQLAHAFLNWNVLE